MTWWGIDVAETGVQSMEYKQIICNTTKCTPKLVNAKG